MEGNLSSGNMNLGSTSYMGLDLQSPIRPHHHQQHPISLHQQHQSFLRPGSMVHPSIHDSFPLTMTSCDRAISLSDFSKGEKAKGSASDDDEPGFTEDTIDGHDDGNRGKKGVPWQRVKWADKMVRLLITAVSYIGEDAVAECGNGSSRRCANLQKKGKWKSISKVMAERGHFVSPQQCEDKFNDLNKRYKRLNEILGRGTSCQVVERPELLERMDHLSEKAKEEVRKILSSKQLFYEEMCSYHNRNRLHLPHDPELQRSLRLALRSRDDHEHNDLKRHPHDDFIEDDQDAELDDRDEFEENNAKKMKQCHVHEDISLGNSLNNFLDFNKTFQSHSEIPQADIHQSIPEGGKENLMQKQWLKQRSLQLEEQKLQIQAQMLELERERFKWQRFCRKGDRELEMMRVENEKMKLENERMAMELKRKEMGIDHKDKPLCLN